MNPENLDNEILDFIQSTGTTISKLESDNRTLRNKVSTLETERMRLEKVASSPKPVCINKEHLSKTLDNLYNLQLINKEGFKKIASTTQDNPELLLNIIDDLVDRMFKMASSTNNLSMISVDDAIDERSEADRLWRKLAQQKKHTFV